MHSVQTIPFQSNPAFDGTAASTRSEANPDLGYHVKVEVVRALLRACPSAQDIKVELVSTIPESMPPASAQSTTITALFRFKRPPKPARAISSGSMNVQCPQRQADGTRYSALRSYQMASYVIGQHGAKRREQRRLTEMYGERVSGRTHESEHTIGFAPLNETSGTKRGGSKIIRQLEKDAWAYQEEKPLHRAHIGTGTQNTPDLSGFNSDTYRETQRTLVEQGHISSAVQVNQLHTLSFPDFMG